jgi:NAD-dependent DNA ligase
MKGFGSKTIEKLDLGDLTEIFSLEFDVLADRIGSEKVAEKLLQEIDKAKSADLATVLSSFSIPLIGQTASKKIASAVGCVEDITESACKTAGLGEKATQNLLYFLQYDLPEMKEFLPFSFQSGKSSTVASTGKTICVTGKLKTFKTKSQAYEALQQAGYVVVESVTKTLCFLVDEENKNSTKRQKADTLGVTIIPNLENFLKENTHD